MKQYLHAFAMCQSMFCAIPIPWQLWDEKARDKMLLFLPLVGLEMGALWACIGWLCRFLGLPRLICALAMSVFPFLATGFLHLDGFMDVTDALRSCRSLQRRREILKDSHVGAFSVIGLVLLVLSQFAFFAAAEGEKSWGILALIPALSRCCSALAVTVLPPMSTSQYAGAAKKRSHAAVLAGMLALVTGAGFWFFGKAGLALMGGLVGYGIALRRAYRGLDGMNGDISGYCLTVSELCAVAVFALI